ncbi:MAG TPA: AAA family ATPase, partial [Armatimonadota bacterium]|nr:AAA family ATPase [Armatimonadota bacterium]
MSEDTAGRKHAISIPEPSLVVLVGTSGSGKSVFANRHFRATEVISSDACRGMVSDDTNDQSVTKDAFEILRFIAAKRLANGKLVVVDATNVQAGARAPMLALAREYHVFAVAIVLDVDKKVCLERNRERPDRNFGAHVVENQRRDLRRSLRRLKREGFRFTHVLKTPEEIDEATVER